MRRLVPQQKVVVKNENKIEIGKIKCLSKVQKKLIFYDVILERGTELIFITTNSEDHMSYIDMNLTEKYFPNKKQ